MIEFSARGDFKKTDAFLQSMLEDKTFSELDAIARQGVSALAAATPVESGETASSWRYEIVKKANSYVIYWTNSHMAGKTPVAILLQYGHGTGTGGYVQGTDFINPAMRPVFERMAQSAWKAVTSA